MDTWTIWASSGEYAETAESALCAAAQFMTHHPDDFISAIVCDGMKPKLVLAENI